MAQPPSATSPNRGGKHKPPRPPAASTGCLLASFFTELERRIEPPAHPLEHEEKECVGGDRAQEAGDEALRKGSRTALAVDLCGAVHNTLVLTRSRVEAVALEAALDHINWEGEQLRTKADRNLSAGANTRLCAYPEVHTCNTSCEESRARRCWLTKGGRKAALYGLIAPEECCSSGHSP